MMRMMKMRMQWGRPSVNQLQQQKLSQADHNIQKRPELSRDLANVQQRPG